MKIKICGDNLERIEKALKEANGKARERTLETFDVFNGMVDGNTVLRKTFDTFEIKKGNDKRICGGQVNAKSYKYRYSTTTATIQRGAKDWFLVDCRRNEFFPESGPKTGVTLTNQVKEKLIEKFKKELENGL